MGKRKKGLSKGQSRGARVGINVAPVGAEGEFLTPAEGAPVLRVVVEPGASSAVQELALGYWSLDAEGQWTNRVSALGDAARTAETVRDHAHAVALALACAGCGELPVVRSRSELDAQGVRRHNGALCEECNSRGVTGPATTAEEGREPGEPGESGEPQREAEEEAAEPEEEFWEPRPPKLRIFDGAPEELVTIAREYWRLSHLELDGEYAVWAGPVKAIDTTGWGPAHIAAGAAARAELPGLACPACEGPLTLTSRTAYEQACFGELPACVDCSPKLLEKMNKLRSAKAAGEATPSGGAGNSRGAWPRNAESGWNALRREELRRLCPLEFLPEAELPTGDVRTEALTLALLHYAPSTTPIEPLSQWGEILHPDPSGDITALARGGFVRLHPDSDVNAFHWKPATFKEAITAAHGDLDAVEPPAAAAYDLRKATHYVPYGTSMGTAATRVSAHLVERLSPAHLDQARREQLLVLAQELIAAEAARYLDQQLAKRHLPAVPENHGERLRSVFQLASTRMSLGEVINVVWRAVRSASDAAQQYPYAPRANMSTAALNSIETGVQAAMDGGKPLKPYTFDPGLLAALTRTVFYRVLEANPFEETAAQMVAALPQPDPEPQAAEPRLDRVPPQPDAGTGLERVSDGPAASKAEALAYLSAHRDTWSVDDFIDHLVYTQSQSLAPRATPRLKAHAAVAGALHGLYEEMSWIVQEPQEAVLATCAAAHHLLGDVEHGALGEALVVEFVARVATDDEAETTSGTRL
ncbi:hypothetical protein ACFW7P_16725 [Streptomyces albidoflavus]